MQQNGTFASDTTLDDLKHEHGTLDTRLQLLDSRRSLSPEEHYEIQVIKKRKLFLKDQISKLETS